MIVLVLGLRGAAAVAVLVVLVGGLPAIVQAGLAAGIGLWAAMIAGPLGGPGDVSWWLVAARELVIGATLGILAGVPLLAAAIAGQLVDLSSRSSTARSGPYRALFGLLAAAVFVGIDGHVALVTAIATSFRDAPPLAMTEPRVLTALGALMPIAARLAVPWLVTAAVIEVAVGVAVRVAGRAATHGPLAAATPAALVMMTASLVTTLAVAIAAVIR
jgi:flagellar biosynthesis protein FliR